MSKVTMTDHVRSILQGLRKNANKADGPFEAEYEISGTIAADASLAGSGDISLSADIPTIGDADVEGSIELDNSGTGQHEYKLRVRISNDEAAFGQQP